MAQSTARSLSAAPAVVVQPAARRAAALRPALLLTSFLALATWYSVVVPPWEAPDESEHVQYVYYLLQERQLPRQLPTIQLSRNDESHQAPLYYALGALFAAWARPEGLAEIRMNPYVTWPDHPARFAVAAHSPTAEAWPPRGAVRFTLALRLFSALLGAVTVLATYLLVRRLLPDRADLALPAAAAVAFLPGFVAASARVNNDALLTALSSLAALATLPAAPTAPLTFRRALGAGGLLALAVAAKISGVVLAAAAVLARLRPRRDLLSEAALLAGPALAAASAWTAFRGSSGEMVGILEWTLGRTATLDGLAGMALNLARTFVGAFGGWQAPLPDGWTALAVALAAPPLLAALARHPDRWLVARIALWPALLLAATAARWWLVAGGQGGFDHARFLYPAIAPLAALLALGWSALPPRLGTALARLLPLALLVMTLAAPPLVIGPAYAFRAEIAAFVGTAPAPGTVALDRPVGPGLRLVGYRLRPECPKPGDVVHLALAWRGEPGERPDGQTAVFLSGPSWPLTRLAERDPGRGLYPPSVWLPEEIVRDEHTFWLASDLPPGGYQLAVRFEPEARSGREAGPPTPFAAVGVGAPLGDGACSRPLSP